jgi:hypothetical protein
VAARIRSTVLPGRTRARIIRSATTFASRPRPSHRTVRADRGHSGLEVANDRREVDRDQDPLSLSARAVEDKRLAELVLQAHDESPRTYGIPRVQAALAEAHQLFVSRKRVIRLFQAQNLKARPRKRFKAA